MQHGQGRDARIGSIEVIVGSMFSGKTEELMRRVRRAQFAQQAVQIFKPKIDNRYGSDQVVSHNKTMMPANVINRAVEIFEHLKPQTQVVCIDEGQFFDDELIDVTNELAGRGLRVIVAGLDMNWKGEPFRPMPELMAIAENVKKLQAVCVVCGQAASHTQRLTSEQNEVLVGGAKVYEARCRGCYDPELAEVASGPQTFVAVYEHDELLTYAFDHGQSPTQTM